MIAGLSKAFHLYLAPLLLLTSLILVLFSYLAPIILFPTQVSLLQVSPSTALTQSKSSDGVDGPSVFLGALGTYHWEPSTSSFYLSFVAGSCARSKNDAPVTCTPPTVSPTYGTFL